MPNIAELPKDRIALRGSSGAIAIAEAYDVQLGMFTQPCAFSVTLGSADIAANIISQFPIGSEFQLLVGGNIQFTGTVDGFVARGGNNGTTVAIRGRDRLGILFDAVARNEESFKDPTFRELTELVLDRAFMGRSWILMNTDDAGRKVRTGVGPPPKGAEVSSGGKNSTFLQGLIDKTLAGLEIDESDPDPGTVQGPKEATYKIKLGEGYYPFLKKEYDRVGLILWSNAYGHFVLSRPDTTQPALYKIGRTPHGNGHAGSSRVISYTFQNEITHRFNVFEVHGRTGGGQFARSKVIGRYVDRELFEYGVAKAWTKKDDNCTTAAQAEYLARRACAEARRAGWGLSYVVAGHTTDAYGGGRAVWAPDTMVDVQDEVIGVSGTFYIESVQHASGPEATTTLRLMRPEDLVIGDEADGEPLKGTKASKPGNPATEGFLTRLARETGSIAKTTTVATAKEKGGVGDAIVIDILENAFDIDLNS